MIHSHTCFQGLCAVLAGAALSHADEPAVSISDFGVDKVMSGPVVSINDQYKGVVKIEMDSLTPDYATPWNTGRYQGGIGTGFLIGENAFMTNAHVVSNAERIYISMYGDSRKIPARVKFIAHDADLALLEADDPRPFKGIRPFEFSKNLPHLEDEVRVIGYPIGGNRLSVTRGVVSRIDFTTYAHPRNTEHLTIQVDAAINPGNSGGPVLMGNKVIGVAFQGLNNANNTGYVIPTPVIRHFLEDIKDGVYDGYVDMGIQAAPILNPAMCNAPRHLIELRQVSYITCLSASSVQEVCIDSASPLQAASRSPQSTVSSSSLATPSRSILSLASASRCITLARSLAG